MPAEPTSGLVRGAFRKGVRVLLSCPSMKWCRSSALSFRVNSCQAGGTTYVTTGALRKDAGVGACPRTCKDQGFCRRILCELSPQRESSCWCRNAQRVPGRLRSPFAVVGFRGTTVANSMNGESFVAYPTRSITALVGFGMIRLCWSPVPPMCSKAGPLWTGFLDLANGVLKV